MNVVLAASWMPRGELPRLQCLTPLLLEIYSSIAIAIPGQVDTHIITALADLPEVTFIQSGMESARHYVLELALKHPGTHIHYCDMDRLLRWAETQPDELRETVKRITEVDVLILGRTEAAYSTHPDALRCTEMLANSVFSDWFGQEMDFCAGSRGMSRGAAAYVLARSSRDSALRMDVEWAVLWKRAGFKIDYMQVDGLDWESADQFQTQAADAERQMKLAREYDASSDNWRLRVDVARDVLRTGLAAQKSNLNDVLTLW